MLNSEQPKEVVSPQVHHMEDQHPSNRPPLIAKPSGMMADAPRIPGTEASSMLGKRNHDSADILRFRESERLLHWAIAIPFMICWVTALILVLVYYPAPLRPYRSLFTVAHRISGICLIVLPVLSVFVKRKDFKIHWENVKNAWLWSLEDLKWLLLMGLAAISKRIVLPEQGKFNAAEKVNFMLVMLGWPVFAVTGTIILCQDQPWIAWLVHCFAAVLVSPTMLGHIYMATINPDTRTGISGMISGYVNRQWAKHHYARWYKEHFVNSSPPHGAHADSKKTPVERRSVEETVDVRIDPHGD